MIALRVQINSQPLIIAGHIDLGGLSAIVSSRGKLGKTSKGTINIKDKVELDLFVGGLTEESKGKDKEHLRWIRNQKLNVGDEITIKIIDVDIVDAPVSREKHDEEKVKKIQEELREKLNKNK